MTTPTKQRPAAGMGKTVKMPFDLALERTGQALAKEGFGILTRIDVKGTLKEKLGVDVAPFVILGACNPTLAHRALTIVPEIGLMLPCNVVVRDLGGGKTRIEAVNPRAMASLFPEVDLEAVSKEVGDRLAKVLEAV